MSNQPIYATLSDIVIYSPKGASPAAIALARKFRAAMKSKREERMRRAAASSCNGVGVCGDEKGACPQPPLPSPPVLSISTSTSTVTPASLANALPSDSNAQSTVDSSFDASPSLNANAISKTTVHTKTTTISINGVGNSHTHSDVNTNTKPEDDEDLLEYNVFVLDATTGDLRREVPYLMMRMCGPGVPGGGSAVSLSNVEDNKLKIVTKAKADAKANNAGLTKSNTEPSMAMSMSSTPISKSLSMSARDALFDVGAHTDGPDGHLIEEGIVEKEERERGRKRMDLNVVDDMDMDMDMDDGNVGVVTKQEEEDVLLPNTVDFALREKEEMRDLTKASEIISLHPEPSVSMTDTPASPGSSTKPGFTHTTILTSSPTTHSPSSESSTKPGFTHTSIPPSSPSAHPSSPSSVPLPSKPETLETKPVWDPLVGQVYLGNSGDVPLAPDVPSHFRHAASLVRDATLKGNPCAGLTDYFRSVDDDEDGLAVDDDDEEALPADDLFNYRATNDPSHGFGYDIAVECHELAPFPSSAHLRAADEHLGTLDLLWKERWERGWRAREEKRISKKRKTTVTEGGVGEVEEYDDPRTPPRAPPRPPPHASAVIHLPFPSSPSNTQTTMVSLMPVVRFLEKWIKPLPAPLPLLPVVPPTPPPPVALAEGSGTGTVTPEMKNLKLAGSGGDAGTVSQTTPPPTTSTTTTTTTTSARRWSSVAALMPSFPSFPLGSLSSSISAPTAVSNNNSESNEASPTSAATLSTPPPACPLPPHPTRNRSFTSPPPPGRGIHQSLPYLPKPQQTRTRPLKILLYSSDGYTESSVPALCLLMAIKSLNLPEAYLELQVVKRRSFFVYQADLGILRRVEARLKEERERERERERGRERERERLNGGFLMGGAGTGGVGSSVNANGKRIASVRGGYWSGTNSATGPGTSYPCGTAAVAPSTPPAPPAVGGGTSYPSQQKSSFTGRPAAKSVSFAQAPHPMTVPSLQHQHDHYQQSQSTASATTIPFQPPHPGTTSYIGQAAFSGSLPAQPHLPFQMPHHPSASSYSGGGGCQEGHQVVKGRPRANTSPWLPSLFGGDHQSWFNDPRFDGSFPSRVLPFLYLGNLNHASNVYMLHALGITHVVSVGECALVPPPHHMPSSSSSSGGVGMNNQSYHRPGGGSNAHYLTGKGPGGHGSLWIEERERRIKVLDIKGVCDDGIDTLEPQLEPICDWIDKARQEGGQVLVHCRVGVSRSATVTIAYVMKHLGLPLVDAYLIVRSRRLSVLIQPNMRLLYNLCGWEIKLAKERAKGDERKIKKELARTLTWPYLAKEVHALNDKYLH